MKFRYFPSSCTSFPRIYVHLTSYNNDRLSEEEAKAVIDEAPLMQTKEGLRGLESPTDSWIDYLLWVEKFAGFRKPRAANYSI
jgi:hypothetical protein